MAIRYTVDSQRSLLQVEVTGMLDRNQLLGLFRTLAIDPRLDPKLRRLTIINASLAPDINAATLGEASRVARNSVLKNATHSRQAIVASSDSAFGVARMYVMLCDYPQETFRIFRNLSEALGWLDVTPVADSPDIRWTTIKPE